MIKNNSGKLFRFKLDHDLGFAFAELYDFSDVVIDYGLLIYIYNQTTESNHEKIRSSGIALGPLRLVKFPNTYGPDAWQFFDQTPEPLITSLPDSKELRGLESSDDNWNKLGDWFRVNSANKKVMEALPYSKVRSLETAQPHNEASVATKMSMKLILDKGEKVSQYYNFNEDNNRLLYIELINTYYPLASIKTQLKDIII